MTFIVIVHGLGVLMTGVLYAYALPKVAASMGGVIGWIALIYVLIWIGWGLVRLLRTGRSLGKLIDRDVRCFLERLDERDDEELKRNLDRTEVPVDVQRILVDLRAYAHEHCSTEIRRIDWTRVGVWPFARVPGAVLSSVQLRIRDERNMHVVGVHAIDPELDCESFLGCPVWACMGCGLDWEASLWVFHDDRQTIHMQVTDRDGSESFTVRLAHGFYRTPDIPENRSCGVLCDGDGKVIARMFYDSAKQPERAYFMVGRSLACTAALFGNDGPGHPSYGLVLLRVLTGRMRLNALRPIGHRALVAGDAIGQLCDRRIHCMRLVSLALRHEVWNRNRRHASEITEQERGPFY